MSIITCTPGGASDNAYITLANANLRFANTLREEAWLAYSITQRERAIVQATQEIEGLGGPRAQASAKRPRFVGNPHNTNSEVQALHFPRAGDTNPDGDYIIPEGVETAVCEQAYWLLQEQTNPQLINFEQLSNQGVSSISLDGISASMKKTDRPENIAPLAWKAIKPFCVNVFAVV